MPADFRRSYPTASESNRGLWYLSVLCYGYWFMSIRDYGAGYPVDTGGRYSAGWFDGQYDSAPENPKENLKYLNIL